METKLCHKCTKDLPTSAFYKNKARSDGLASSCKTCHKKENVEYRHRHPDRVYHKELTAKQLIKVETFSHYSKGTVKCQRCGFSDLRALSIDHINGNGGQHRKELARCGTAFYRWLRDNDYPDGYQVLCMNCQWIKRDENCEHNGRKIKQGREGNPDLAVTVELGCQGHPSLLG